MDLAKLIQLLMSMQNKTTPDPSTRFENRQSDPKPKSETAPHHGWEPDPDRAGATEAEPSGGAKQTTYSDGDTDLSKLLPLLLQMMSNRNSGGTDSTNADGGTSGTDLASLLPLLLQMMSNRNSGGTNGANADGGTDLSSLLPLLLQMMSNRNSGNTDSTNADGSTDLASLLPLLLRMMSNRNSSNTDSTNANGGTDSMDLASLLPLLLRMMSIRNSGGTDSTNADGGTDLSSLLPLLLQMMSNRNSGNTNGTNADGGTSETPSETGWSESEFAPNDVRQQTEHASQTSNQPHGTDNGPVRTQPTFDDSGYPTQTTFYDTTLPDRTKAPLRTRTAEAQTSKKTDSASRTSTPRGLLPVAFAPPSMIYRLNLYFAHANA